MTRKDMKWNWAERQQRAFEELKERFTTEPVLVIPDLDKEMRVETDALDFVIVTRVKQKRGYARMQQELYNTNP